MNQPTDEEIRFPEELATDVKKSYFYLIEIGYPFYSPYDRCLSVRLAFETLAGTHQGEIQQQHIDYYFDKFAFRFNR
jgi:hypothetical protein